MTPAKTYTTNTISEVLLNYGFSEHRVNQFLESMGKVELLSSPAEPEFIQEYVEIDRLRFIGRIEGKEDATKKAQLILDLVNSKVKPLEKKVNELTKLNYRG